MKEFDYLAVNFDEDNSRIIAGSTDPVTIKWRLGVIKRSVSVFVGEKLFQFSFYINNPSCHLG